MTFEEQAATLDQKEIVALLASHENLTAQVVDLTSRIEWFKQQIFGTKSERRWFDAEGRQLALGDWNSDHPVPDAEVTIAEHRRRVLKKPVPKTDEEKLRFDDSVPVEEIRFPLPDLEEGFEVIGEKITTRLAQKPASYVVLKYIRPVVKRKEDDKIFCPPAPAGALGKSLADESLLASMAIDKFLYHLPLYRQHQRMAAAGIRISRSALTGLMQRTADLLSPIYEALLESVIGGNTVTMDETPIKAGRKHRGKMKTGYFWPIYGDQKEIVFPFSHSRSGEMLRKTLGEFQGVLLSDGYKAYETYASQINGLVHAQCWSHTRRQFIKAEDIEPKLTETALRYIRDLYGEEEKLKGRIFDETKRLEHRARHCKPIVEEFFEWLKTALEKQLLLPMNPFTKAANYALSREGPLKVFLEYPDLPIDTNHLEREIRPIALGRKNWMFCWTEVGAQDVGIFQSLLATCRLQGIDPYTYFVDVLQRVDDHPASDVAALTPRLWKERFADNPYRSAIDRIVKDADT